MTLTHLVLLIGTKIIFWDMRESFINNLYKNNVSQFRLETITEELDSVRII